MGSELKEDWGGCSVVGYGAIIMNRDQPNSLFHVHDISMEFDVINNVTLLGLRTFISLHLYVPNVGKSICEFPMNLVKSS